MKLFREFGYINSLLLIFVLTGLLRKSDVKTKSTTMLFEYQGYQIADYYYHCLCR